MTNYQYAADVLTCSFSQHSGHPHHIVVIDTDLPNTRVHALRKPQLCPEAFTRIAYALRTVSGWEPISFRPGAVSPKAYAPHHDLAAAVSLLVRAGNLDPGHVEDCMFWGELNFAGSVVGTRGAFPAGEAAASAAITHGVKYLFVPWNMAPAATLGVGNFGYPVKVVGVDSLAHTAFLLRDKTSLPAPKDLPPREEREEPCSAMRWLSSPVVRTLQHVARTRSPLLLLSPATVSTAGAANLLASLIPLSRDAQRHVARTHCLAGLGGVMWRLPERATFRAPHSSVSTAGLLGSADWMGEVTLAQFGVLLLDGVMSFRPRHLAKLAEALDTTATRHGWYASCNLVLTASLDAYHGASDAQRALVQRLLGARGVTVTVDEVPPYRYDAATMTRELAQLKAGVLAPNHKE